MQTDYDPLDPGNSLENNKPRKLVVPVIEEYVTSRKEVVETGRVEIVKQVHEVTETVDTALFHDEYAVEHVPVNEFVEDLPSMRKEGDTTIIPVLKEIMVKRTLLVEEIRITRRKVLTNDQQQVMLRKEEVKIERKSTDR